jgi:hypothetical protein
VRWRALRRPARSSCAVSVGADAAWAQHRSLRLSAASWPAAAGRPLGANDAGVKLGSPPNEPPVGTPTVRFVHRERTPRPSPGGLALLGDETFGRSGRRWDVGRLASLGEAVVRWMVRWMVRWRRGGWVGQWRPGAATPEGLRCRGGTESAEGSAGWSIAAPSRGAGPGEGIADCTQLHRNTPDYPRSQ